MFCPKCKGNNISVQAVSEVQKRGCFASIGWILLAICTLGIILLIPFLSGKKSKTKTYAICQDCGYRWEVSNPKKVQVVKTKVINATNISVQNTDNYTSRGSNDDILWNVCKWLNEEIWNNGFYLVDCYIKIGVNPDDDSVIDINEVLELLNRKMKLAEEYGRYILNLSGDQYTDLKEAWAEAYQEAKRLMNYIAANTPRECDENFEFDTETFQKKREELCGIIREI